MRRFEIAGAVLNEDEPAFSVAIAAAYRNRIRPLCLCRQPGVPMYVAAMGEQHVIKRMPLSGGQHDPDCDSYEPPVDLSGLGALMGSAIRLDPTSGMAALRLEFSLTRTGSRAAPTPGAVESTSVKSEAGTRWHSSTQSWPKWAGSSASRLRAELTMAMVRGAREKFPSPIIPASTPRKVLARSTHW